MDYKLAKELKEAGFPQPTEGEYVLWKGNCLMSDGSYQDIGCDSNELPKDISEWAYIPTLEELIEAYGKNFRSIIFMDFDTAKKKNTDWLCSAPLKRGQREITRKQGWGPTPVEAVARLWLRLNKK